MSGASCPLSVLCPRRSSRFGVTLSSCLKSLGGRTQTQRSLQAVSSAKQCCLMSPLFYCSDSELIYLLLIRHKAKLCPHCIPLSSCFGPAAPCSLHSHNTAVCYSMLPSNTLSPTMSCLFASSSSSLPLSHTSPSLLFLTLPSFPAFMYPDLQLGGEREQGR